MDCIFCKISNSEIPSYKLYEDDLVIVLLDINPRMEGHSLIIPKKHYVTINDLDDELVLHINNVTKDIYKLFKEKLNITGLRLQQNNDSCQEVMHYHMHLIPHYDLNTTDFKYEKINVSVKETYDKIMN